MAIIERIKTVIGQIVVDSGAELPDPAVMREQHRAPGSVYILRRPEGPPLVYSLTADGAWVDMSTDAEPLVLAPSGLPAVVEAHAAELKALAAAKPKPTKKGV